jgi:hypothetical protein
MNMPVATPTLRAAGRSITRRYAAAVPAARLLACPAAVLGLLLGVPVPTATAAAPPTLNASPRLWATINVCDTEGHPNTVGIRASMPGDGRTRERMYMRFRLQYFTAATGRWQDLGPSGDSGFVSVGSAKFTRREGGQDFELAPPETGQTYRVRGVVSFEWRLKGRVVRQASKRTVRRKAPVRGADPKGFSAGQCVVSAP